METHMLKQEQIKKLAEIAGWKSVMQSYHNGTWFGVAPGWEKSVGYDGNVVNHMLPDFLNDYNAIIPLIQKQPYEVRVKCIPKSLALTPLDFDATQLCEALLKALGKWKE